MSGGETCGAKTRDGGTCRKPAGWGTERPVGRCRLHGGNTPTHAIAAQKILAARALNTYGTPRQIDPRDGLIEEYWRTAGAVSWLEERVQALGEEDLVWGVSEEKTTSGDPDADDTGQPAAGRETKRKAAPSIWLTLYQQERKKFSDLGVEILRLGLEARRDEYGKRMALQAHGFLSRAIDRAGLTAEMRAQLVAALAAEIGEAVAPQIEGMVA